MSLYSRSYSATADDLKSIHETFGGVFSLPHNFERTAPLYKPEDKTLKNLKLPALAEADARSQKQAFFSNPQTELLCAMLELINPNAVLMGKESYNLAEMANRLLVQREEKEDDEDDIASSDEDELGPSPSKSARSIPNPEEINLDDVDDDGTGGGGDSGCQNKVYGSPITVIPANENEYNPEPVVKNPEVIDIDDLDDDDDDGDPDEEKDGSELEAYEPCPTSGCGIDLGVTYDPHPVSGISDVQSKHD